jgi:hypothetical protein
MKTKQMLMLTLLLGVLFGREAQAFYNPSTGRWLSRDPIGERGGNNLYCAFRNEPISTFDPRGLIPPQSGPYPPQRRICNPCKCKQVKVTGQPVGPPGVGWYRLDTSHSKYGNLMTITWQVDGNPKKCIYGQDESGNSNAKPQSGDGLPKQSHYTSHPDVSVNVSVAYGSDSATYNDEMGIPFSMPNDKGQWTYTLDLTINFTCTSSDGSKMTGLTQHFSENGKLSF